jgi:CO dehydrogenase/acetyl-CoA synthase alpha subunit
VSEPNNAPSPRVLLAGHSSSHPEEVAQALHIAESRIIELDQKVDISVDVSQTDLFILVISAKTGVSSEMTSAWNYVAERQVPRMVIVNGLEMSEIDFDDIVLIANRVLEPVITPYLVLHDEVGEPVGLISLTDNTIRDYSTSRVNIYDADAELQSLVTDFKKELEESTIEFDSDAFHAGLIVPALPLVSSRQIGVTEFQNYLALVTKR